MGRTWTVALFCYACLASVCGCTQDEPASAGSQVPEAGTAAGKDWSKDDRLLPYMTRCPELGHFDGDTSDILAVLVGKLANSSRDVLRNVREELAAGGEPAMREIDRMVRRLYGDRFSAHAIANALGVLQMSESGSLPICQELLRACLGHPQDTVRDAAIRALSAHASPALYDDLLAVLRIPMAASRSTLVMAMYGADRRRTERLVASWIEEGSHSELLEEAARMIAGGADAETAALFAPLLERLAVRRVKAFLTATQSHASDPPEALAYLEQLLQSEDSQARADALMALEFTKRVDLVAHVLTSDPDNDLRRMACGGLVPWAEDPIGHKALVVALYDSDPKVREEALSALLAMGDRGAADTLLDLWGGAQQDIAIATRSIAGQWEKHPGLGERALALLRERLDEHIHEGLTHTEYLLQAIAQIPGPGSTRLLLDLAAKSTDRIKGLSDFRFLTLQASNTGPVGRELLRESWRHEEDAEHRFDLLWAGTLAHDESTSKFLIEVLQAERSLPHERLWVAERLAREGPAAKVAALIKRANIRMSDKVFRPAMECLLWRWYG